MRPTKKVEKRPALILKTNQFDSPEITKEYLQYHEKKKAENIIRCKETIKSISLRLQTSKAASSESIKMQSASRT